jgi:hypothetical protein
MEAKFGPLQKRIKAELHQSSWNFSDEQPGTHFLNTKGMNKFGGFIVESVDEKLKRWSNCYDM